MEPRCTVVHLPSKIMSRIGAPTEAYLVKDGDNEPNNSLKRSFVASLDTMTYFAW